MSLQRIENELKTINPEQVRLPNMPIPVALQEASDLLLFARGGGVLARLVAVGQSADFPDDLAARIDAAREAQSLWVAERDRSKSQQLVVQEERAAALRSLLVAAGRYNLRHDREAQAQITGITGGTGVADLIQDLHDLAALFTKHASSFEQDTSFDVEERTRQARELADQLSLDVSEERAPSDMRLLRDRAFTYLDMLVSDIRLAGRYAFREDAAERKRFASRYRRRRNSRGKSGEAETEIVEEEIAADAELEA